jgi:hypothetical protein
LQPGLRAEHRRRIAEKLLQVEASDVSDSGASAATSFDDLLDLIERG